MKNFLLKSLMNMLGIYLATQIFPAITVSSPEAVFWTGLVLGLISLFLRPLLLLITLPINLITLGLFTLVINTWLLMLAAYLTQDLHLPSFSLAFATAFIIAIGHLIAEGLVKK